MTDPEMNEEEHSFDTELLINDYPTSSKFELLYQGAEARLYKGVYFGRPVIVKERFSKKYRHPALDAQLTKERMKAELRSVVRCRNLGLEVASVYFVDSANNRIYFEYLEDAITVREHINRLQSEHTVADFLDRVAPVARQIGRLLATLHKNNLIHGDLTTSNMLLRTSNPTKTSEKMDIDATANITSLCAEPHSLPETSEIMDTSSSAKFSDMSGTTKRPNPGETNQEAADAMARPRSSPEKTTKRARTSENVDEQPRVVLIDFGLSYGNKLAEDKGVDLYVMEKACTSTHPNSEKVVDMILQSYCEHDVKGSKAVMKKFEEVKLRGRKREMVG